MEDQLKELLPFLHDRNPAVRQIALSTLLGQTPKEAPHRNIFFAGQSGGGLKNSKENEVIRDLKLLCRDQVTIAHDAFRALVNLSDSSLLASNFSDQSFLCFIVSYLLNPKAVLADLAAMLLSNLSASSITASALLTLKIPIIPDITTSTGYYPTQSRCATCPAPDPYPPVPPREVEALSLLVDAFVQSALITDKAERDRKGELNFLSSVFANISMTPAGRTFFLTPRHTNEIESTGELEYPLAKLQVFTEHPDVIRRGGVASTIKNCAFHAPAHRALLLPDSDRVAIPPSTVEAPGLDILPYILLPLAGPEEFELDDQERLPPALQFLPASKKREPDPVLRLTHVETLLLLCTTRWGRNYSREHGTYEVIRAAHMEETVDNISEHIERLVNLLKREEAPETAGEGVGAVATGSDDEDSKIEEV